MRDEILSREEIQRLIERNNANDAIGRPVYEPWTNHKFVGGQKESGEKAPANLRAWEKRLNSKTFKIQMKGKKAAEVVTRQIKLSSGWTLVPMNARGK